jgi:hypothetical protein
LITAPTFATSLSKLPGRQPPAQRISSVASAQGDWA